MAITPDELEKLLTRAVGAVSAEHVLQYIHEIDGRLRGNAASVYMCWRGLDVEVHTVTMEGGGVTPVWDVWPAWPGENGQKLTTAATVYLLRKKRKTKGK